MSHSCTAVVFGEPVCTQQCGACAEWDQRRAAQEAPQWRHHAGAGALIAERNAHPQEDA